MLLEDDELLSLFIKYMQSDDLDIIKQACWTITNMINYGSEVIIRKVIQTDHCIECCIDVINKIEDEELVNEMIMALSKCIQVESGLKELYIRKNLKEILENHDHIDKSNKEYKKLLSALKRGSRKGNEFVNKRRRKR